MSRYRRIVEYFTTHPWAIQRESLDGMVELIRLRVEGGRFAEDEIAARLAAARAQQGERRAESFVGVIPIYGVIMPRANLMTEMSGGTTVAGLTQQFRAAIADPEVSRIVFDVDSPGGSVEGIPELAAEIRNARGTKPMSAVANYKMCSAAYWLASGADEIVASLSAFVGSIGVYGVHEDWSAANEQMGFKPTYVYAGKYKVEGNPDEPLDDVALGHIQESVDYSYDQFVADVAAGRGASKTAVRDGFGEGRALDPQPALAAGLVDRVATFDQVLAEKPPRMKARRQAAGGLEPVAMDPVDEPDVPEPTEPDTGAFEFERERRARLGLRPA